MHRRDKAFPVTFNTDSATLPKEKVQDYKSQTEKQMERWNQNTMSDNWEYTNSNGQTMAIVITVLEQWFPICGGGLFN